MGDRVGLYFPHGGTWLGCAPEDECHNTPTCPGVPNTRTGFESSAKWDQCYGEVFRIYTATKGYGQIIEDQDPIMLQYVAGGNWLALAGNGNLANKQPCPGKAPPSYSKYEDCWGEVFILKAINF